jgi:prevent-host-death family protein
MKRVPIAEFKAHCSSYVERVAQEEIVITKHGRPVARLVAENPADERTVWEIYESLKAKNYKVLGDIFSTGEKWDAES